MFIRTLPSSGLFVSPEAVEEEAFWSFAWFGPNVTSVPAFELFNPQIRLSVHSATIESEGPDGGPEFLPPGNVMTGVEDMFIIQQLTAWFEKVGHGGNQFFWCRDGA